MFTTSDLYEKLSRLQWLMMRHNQQRRGGPTSDPSRGQGRVLALLKLQPEISTKDLSYLLGIRQQSLNELLIKLERAECIERIPLPTDRRITMVRLTEKGRTQQQADTDFDEIFAGLSPEEQQIFAQYIDSVIATLEEKLGPGNDDEFSRWRDSARSRMGEEQFNLLASRYGGRAHHGRGRCHDDHAQGGDCPRHGQGHHRGREWSHEEHMHGEDCPRHGQNHDCPRRQP